MASHSSASARVDRPVSDPRRHTTDMYCAAAAPHGVAITQLYRSSQASPCTQTAPSVTLVLQRSSRRSSSPKWLDVPPSVCANIRGYASYCRNQPAWSRGEAGLRRTFGVRADILLVFYVQGDIRCPCNRSSFVQLYNVDASLEGRTVDATSPRQAGELALRYFAPFLGRRGTRFSGIGALGFRPGKRSPRLQRLRSLSCPLFSGGRPLLSRGRALLGRGGALLGRDRTCLLALAQRGVVGWIDRRAVLQAARGSSFSCALCPRRRRPPLSLPSAARSSLLVLGRFFACSHFPHCNALKRIAQPLRHRMMTSFWRQNLRWRGDRRRRRTQMEDDEHAEIADNAAENGEDGEGGHDADEEETEMEEAAETIHWQRKSGDHGRGHDERDERRRGGGGQGYGERTGSRVNGSGRCIRRCCGTGEDVSARRIEINGLSWVC